MSSLIPPLETLGTLDAVAYMIAGGLVLALAMYLLGVVIDRVIVPGLHLVCLAVALAGFEVYRRLRP